MSQRKIKMSESILGHFSAGNGSINRTLIESGTVSANSPMSSGISILGQVTQSFITEISNYPYFCLAVSDVSYTFHSLYTVWARLRLCNRIDIFYAEDNEDNTTSLIDPFNLQGSGTYYAPLNTDIYYQLINSGNASMAFTWYLYGVTT